MNHISASHFIGIDWSGAEYPEKSGAISISLCKSGDEAPYLVGQSPSRLDVFDFILAEANKDFTSFVGIDCNLGLQMHVAKKMFGADADIFSIWRDVDKVCQDDSNFYARKFWTHEDYNNCFWVEGAKPAWFSQNSKRQTEHAVSNMNLGNPESPFKLIGPKQVGKGGLSGMRLVFNLKKILGDKISIWPFEKVTSKTKIVIAEIYPRLFWTWSGIKNQKVKDVTILNQALQFFGSKKVIKVTELSDHDTDAIVTSVGIRNIIQSNRNRNYFEVPKQYQEFAKLEGWIFGI
jgi:hypothetical protein